MNNSFLKPIFNRSIKVTLFSEIHIKKFSNHLLTYHQIAPFCWFISLEKTPTSTSGEFRNKLVSVGVQSPTEIKASGGLQECAYEDVSKADAHSAARTLGAFLNALRNFVVFCFPDLIVIETE